MAEWYCHVGESQYGPVSEDMLRQWIREGRVRANDYVWTQGMANWAPVGAVPALSGLGGPPPLPGGLAPPPAGGTGGQTPVTDLLGQAWNLLRGNWGIAIGVTLLFFVINMAVGLLPYAGGLVSLVLTGPFTLGILIFHLTIARMGRPELGMMFAGFKNFGTALAAYLLMTVFVLGWALVGLVPGVLIGLAVGLASELVTGLLVGAVTGGLPAAVLACTASLRYSQTFYLLADRSNLGPLEAITASKHMMNGQKLRLFWLWMLNGLLMVLGMLACGLGWILIMPLVSVGLARFYDDLRPPAQAGVQAMGAWGTGGAAPATPAPGGPLPPG